jgi:hypothetical protein
LDLQTPVQSVYDVSDPSINQRLYVCITFVALKIDIIVCKDQKEHWQVLLVEVPGENHRPVASHWQTLSHNVVVNVPFDLYTL